MRSKNFSWKARARSFKYAFRGISYLASEHNAWIHAVVAVAVITAGFFLHLSRMEWMAISISIGGVLMAEGFNTAIERLADKVSIEKDPLIGQAKDVAAGAVLCFVTGAVAVGLLIFIPALKRFFLL